MRHYLKWGSYLIVLLHVTVSCDGGELSKNGSAIQLYAESPTPGQLAPKPSGPHETLALSPEVSTEADTQSNSDEESASSPEDPEPPASSCDGIECGNGGFCYELNSTPRCECPDGYHPDSRASGLLCTADATLESCGADSANCTDAIAYPIPDGAEVTCTQDTESDAVEYSCSFQCGQGLEARFALEQWVCSPSTQELGNERFLNHQLLIKPTNAIGHPELLSSLEQIGASIEEGDSLVTQQLGYYKISLPHEVQAMSAMTFLLEEGLIDSVFPNHTTTSTSTIPNDPRWNQAWNMEAISAPAAWDVTTNSGDTIVAVLDSGFDPYHPDLAPNVWYNTLEIPNNGIDDDENGKVDDTFGWDTLDDDNYPIDSFDNHGTTTAGIIGAVGDNATGVAGVAWTTQLMNLRVLSYNRGDAFSLTEGLLYAANNGAQVINLSLTVDGHNTPMFEALESLQEQGIIVVVAAGNDGVSLDFFPNYPSAYELDNLVSVAASTLADSLESSSNFGAQSVDLAAPGQLVPTTTLENGYITSSGTSTAAPHVTGALALYRTLEPELSHTTLIKRLLGTTDAVEALDGLVVSGGRLNMGRLINLSPCAEGQFGYSCAPCTCIHGTCNDGFEGSGECSECEEGWAGADCTRCATNFFGVADDTTSCLAAFSGQANITERELALACTCIPCLCANGQCSSGLTGHGGCLACDASFHLANPVPPSTCVSNDTIDSCTALGVDCIATAPDLTVAGCNGSQCTYSCVEGSHDDGGVCTSDLTLSSCGPSGINCSTTSSPENTIASCDGTACSWTCSEGYEEVTIDGERTCLFAEGTPCLSNEECAGSCAQNLCTSLNHTGNPCDEGDSGDCANELTCISNYCLGNNGKSCATNGECENTCIQGVCTEQSSADGACDAEDSEDCATGYACEFSQCVSTTTCGDGIWVRGAEDCDDGNTLAADGCSEDCKIETGFACLIDDNLLASCRPCILHVDSHSDSEVQSANSWSHASSELAATISLAQSYLENANGNCSAIEVWIREGSYQTDTLDLSTSTTTANPSFSDGLRIYGGFQGIETTLAQRELGSHPTLLSPSTPARIFNIESVPYPTTLDGISIEQGLGNDSDGLGGAIRCENSAVTLQNLKLSGNVATDGGAIGSVNCQLTLLDTHLTRNQAQLGGSGGALYARGGSISADRVWVHGNRAVSYGGGIFLSYLTEAALSNIVLVGNQAQVGAGLSLWSIPLATLTHMSLVENTASTIADSIYAFGSELGIANSIILDPTDRASTISSSNSSLASSCIRSLLGANSSIDVITNCEPAFQAAPGSGADQIWGTADDDYGNLSPQVGQPTIDAGNSTITSSLNISTDASSATRICGASVDIGAYESQVACSE